MTKFYPYNIRHLPLDAIINLEPDKEPCFYVFWWNNIPLGHFWAEGELLRLPYYKFRGMAMEAVTPALLHYTGGNLSADGLQELLSSGNRDELRQIIDRSFSFRPNSAEDGLSVVICTRNRPEPLSKCINALMASSDRKFELIVVDNAPDDDRTREIVSSFPGVRYIREDRKGLDIARNTGAKFATHSIIAYSDDDVTVDRDWIRNIKTCFNDPMTMAVTGLVLPAELRTYSQYAFERHWGFNRGYLPLVFDHLYFRNHVDYGVPVWDIGAGANMAFRKEAFELVGYFDERLDVGASGCSGDSEFWYRLLAEGWNCRYFPNAVVYHHHRASARDLKKQIFNYMRGQVSSLMVQYENYGHEGNLFRVREGLKQYYKDRIRRFLRGSRSERMNTIMTEIRGCISGWQFYQKHQHQKREDQVRLPACLSEEAVVNEDTLVSVIIPCYNQGRFLRQAIHSALTQTYKKVELIVVDDGSSDDIRTICEEYDLINYVRVERVGLSAARNIGVMHSRGSYVLFLDADDVLYPNAIELNLFYFRTYKWAVFVSGGHDRIDTEGNLLQQTASIQKIGDNYKALLQGNYIGMQGTVLYRRELFFAFHFDPKLKACEDYDLNLRISRHYSSVSHTNKIAGYRLHDSNMSKDRGMMYDMAIKVLQRQQPALQRPDEKNDYQLGLLYWKNYYQTEKQTMPEHETD